MGPPGGMSTTKTSRPPHAVRKRSWSRAFMAMGPRQTAAASAFWWSRQQQQSHQRLVALSSVVSNTPIRRQCGQGECNSRARSLSCSRLTDVPS